MINFRKVHLLEVCVHMVLHESYSLVVALIVKQCFGMPYISIGVCE